MQQQSFTEAPASINLRFDYRGANMQFTLRETTGTELLNKLDAVLDRLEAMGATFGTSNGRAQQVAPAGAPVCPTHGVPMKESKFGGWYCPEKVADNDGTGKPIYCKQKSK
jgi:hypothetical protein